MRSLLRKLYKHLSETISGFVWPCATPKEDSKLGLKPKDTGTLLLDAPQPGQLADLIHRAK
eukprot:1788223-Ditylum_brightwellii.AAC.1